MGKLAEICIHRPVFALMLVMAMVVIGGAGYARMGVDRLPSVDLPTVSVRTSLAGASAGDVERELSELIEQAVNTVEGIEELRSISGQGSSIVVATFSLDRNIDVATQDVRDRIAAIRSQLPPEAEEPLVRKVDNDDQPVLTISLYGELDLRELTEIADKVVRPQLERAAGVGDVSIVGGLERAIDIQVDADRLAAHRLPITAVRDAIRRHNSEVPGGNVTSDDIEKTVRTLGRIDRAPEFANVVITRVNGSPLRVGDVARVQDGVKEQRTVSRLNGKPSVTIEIIRQRGANTIAVIDGVKATLESVRAQLPPGLNMEVIRDQSVYIKNALHEIQVHLLLGALLASLVVLAFMKSWRSTLIAAVAIPASTIATFAVMSALGFTLNSVTMLALVLMVGIVIDDAIVVLENTFRFAEEKGMPPLDAAKYGTAEIALAVMATTFSLVVIFIPVSFMSSISGRFLYQFGITAAVAVLVSMMVSFTLTPMMSSRMLKVRPGKNHGADSRKGFYRHIDRSYTALLSWVMRRRSVVVVVALGVIASSIPLFGLVRQEFVPTDVDEAEFSVYVSAPEQTSFAAMNEAMKAVERELLDMPQIEVVLSNVGRGFLGQVNTGSVHVRIQPHEQRIFSVWRLVTRTLQGDPGAAWRGNYSQREVMQQVRAKLRKFSDLRTSVRNYSSFNIGGGNFDILFNIRGPDLFALADYTERLRQMTRDGTIAGVIDADTSLKVNKPELQVRIDRERASDLRVVPQDIGAALRLMVGGDDRVSRFRDPVSNENYDVVVRLRPEDRTRAGQLPRLLLAGGGGDLVELRSFAYVDDAIAPARIDRLDRQRAASVRASVGDGYALGDRIAAMRAGVEQLNLPAGYTVSITGRARELERTYGEFIIAFILSIVFMYMILASNYESLVDPFTILLSIPLSVPFALLSLYLMGGTLNLYSALGLLVLFGVVKKNAILQIDHMKHLRREGMPRLQAIIQGNRDRLRPILMTTFSLVGGMLPLALGTGPGAEERRAVAVVVIGGQTLALVLTLVVTPVVYSLLDDLAAVVTRRRAGAGDAAGPSGGLAVDPAVAGK